MAPLALAIIAFTAVSSAAFAHTGAHPAGFADGLAHPFSGLDHVLAMVAVGLWAAQLGRRACWVLPAAFPAVMTLGAVLGANGVPLPWVEVAIAGSVLTLGAAIALARQPSVPISVALVAVFALFHGDAHGAELPDTVWPLAYGAGFIAATVALHAIGLALGMALRWPAGVIATRSAGAAIAAVGVLLAIT